MSSIKQRPLLILFIFQQLILSVFCYSHSPDFIIEEGPRSLVLRQTLRIPVGSRESVSNSPHLSRYGTPCVDVPEETLLYEIPSIITQRREELGLSSQIPLDQQNEFFQNLTWSRSLSFGTFPITPPIPGRVRQILAQQGQRVARGTPLCIVEAMKMEMTLRAPYSGRIHQILAQENSVIDTNNVLIVLEPSVPFWETLDPSLIAQHRDFFFSFFPWERTLPKKNEPAVTVAPAPENTGENTTILDQRENTPTLDLALTHTSFPNPQPVEMTPSFPVVSHEQPEILTQPIPAPMPRVDEESVQPSTTGKKADEVQKSEQTISSPVLQNAPLIVTNTPEEAKVKETQKPQQVTEQAKMIFPLESQSLKLIQAPMPVNSHPITEKPSKSTMVTLSSPSPVHEEQKLNMVSMELAHKPLIEKSEVTFSERKPLQSIEASSESNCVQESIIREGKLNFPYQITTKRVTYNNSTNNCIVILAKAGIHGNQSEDRKTMDTCVATRVLTETWIPAFARMTVKRIATCLIYYFFDGDLVSLSAYTNWLEHLFILGNLLLSIKIFQFPFLFAPFLSIRSRNFSSFSSLKFFKAQNFNQHPLLKEFKGCNENYKPLRQKKNRVKRYAYLGLHEKLGQYCAS